MKLKWRLSGEKLNPSLIISPKWMWFGNQLPSSDNMDTKWWVKGLHRCQNDHSYTVTSKISTYYLRRQASSIPWGTTISIPRDSKARDILMKCPWLWVVFCQVAHILIAQISQNFAGWWPSLRKSSLSVKNYPVDNLRKIFGSWNQRMKIAAEELN